MNVDDETVINGPSPIRLRPLEVHEKRKLRELLSGQSLERNKESWKEILSNVDIWRYGIRYQKMVLCAKRGIPSEYRKYAWYKILEAEKYKIGSKHSFKNLWKIGSQGSYRDIEVDLERVFPNDPRFNRDGRLFHRLKKVLVAYCVYDPVLNYSQHMSPVAGFLLNYYNSEKAFWCFVAIMDQILGYYHENNLENLLHDCKVFDIYISKYFPHVSDYFNHNNIYSIEFCVTWFLTLYVRTLKWPFIERVWDTVIVIKRPILFSIGLGMISLIFDDSENLRLDSYTARMILSRPPPELSETQILMAVSAFYSTSYFFSDFFSEEVVTTRQNKRTLTIADRLRRVYRTVKKPRNRDVHPPSISLHKVAPLAGTL